MKMNAKYKHMKNIKKTLDSIIIPLISIVILFPSCTEDHQWDTVLYEKGTFDATASVTVTDTVFGGESVTFTDLSTKVYSRQWSFAGGYPASSTDSVVNVIYTQSSKVDTPFVATLTVKYFDNQTETRQFYITVKGKSFLSYGIFTDDPTKTFGTLADLQVNSGYTMSTLTDASLAFEGENYYSFLFTSGPNYAMGSVITAPYGSYADLSAFENGTYNVAIKTNCVGIFVLRLQSNYGSQKALVTIDPIDETYGLKRDGNWHMLSIPVQDFLTNNPLLELSKITELLVLRSDPDGTVGTGEDWDFYLDNFYLEVEEE
jgi:hypothetical protein